MNGCFRVLLLGVALLPGVRAEFQFLVVDSAGEHVPGATYDFGPVSAGDLSSKRFRLRNLSASAAGVSALAVAGAGFTLDAPPLPLTLPAQGTVDFTVNFQTADPGGYSAVLRSEGLSILLFATVSPGLTVQFGDTDFGGVERGKTAVRSFAAANDSQEILPAPALRVDGPDFSLPAPVPSGGVPPGGRLQFSIEFRPSVAGIRRGTLTLGGRTFSLIGIGIEPALPVPRLRIDGFAQSGQQGIVRVDFDAPARTSGSGSITLEFTPLVAGSVDRAILLANGARTAVFPISQGDTAASAGFQTGTTAGTLTFSVAIGTNTDRAVLEIPPSAVVVTASQLILAAGSLEVRLSGFDNTRSAGPLAFTFSDDAGKVIAPGTLRVDGTPEFARYFQASDTGAFALRAVFPVTGDPGRIAAVDASITNTAGSAVAHATVMRSASATPGTHRGTE
jgi:hypothetical protein